MNKSTSPNMFDSGVISPSEEAKELNEEQLNKITPPQMSVMEKVILCVDGSLVTSNNDDPSVLSLVALLHNYIIHKKTIAVNNVEFHVLLMISRDIMIVTEVKTKKDCMTALSPLKQWVVVNSGETEFDFDAMFRKITDLVVLPDVSYYGEDVPPPYIYHVLLLFGHNSNLPTLKSTNAYNFLINSPYFTMDIFYLYDQVENNYCEIIFKMLESLIKNTRGYFVYCPKFCTSKRFGCMSELLGHPLTRPCQLKAKFGLLELFPNKKESTASST